MSDGVNKTTSENTDPPSDPAAGDDRPSRRRRWFRFVAGLLVVGITIAITLLVAEVGVRLFNPQVLFPRYVTDGPFGTRVNVPNARYWHTSPEMRAQFRINAMGIRSDREFTLDKPPGVLRIVGLGDSFTQGYEVNVEETYLFRLQQLLGERGLNVEVINLGVSGYGTAEELVMLREFGFKFNPDVVVVGYYTNDISDNVRSHLFAIDDEDSLVRAAESYLPAIEIRNRLYSYWVYRKLAENSHLFALVRERFAMIVKKSKELDHTPPVRREGAANDYALRLTAALLDRIKLDCDERGIDLVVLDIPPESLNDSEMLKTFPKVLDETRIVHPGPKLREEGEDAYLYRRQGHFHWTPRAHEIATELLADRLVPLLENRQRSSWPL